MISLLAENDIASKRSFAGYFTNLAIRSAVHSSDMYIETKSPSSTASFGGQETSSAINILPR